MIEQEAPPGPAAPPERARSRLSRALPWFLSSLLVAGLTAGGILVATPPGDESQLQALFPLDLGTTWAYRTTTDGKDTGPHVVQVTGAARSTAQTGVVIEHSWANYFGRGPIRVAQGLSMRAGRLLETGNRVGGTFAQNVPPQPVVTAPVTAGRTWSWKGLRFNQRQRSTAEIVGIEPVVVLGGRVDGCAHLRSRVHATDADGKPTLDVIESWICPGVGLVRSRDAETDSNGMSVEQEELAAVDGPGIDPTIAARSTASPTGIAPPGVGATSAVDQARTNAVPDAGLDLGHYAWTMARKENAHFSPVGTDRLMVLAEDDGSVSATDPGTGRVLWQVRLAPPIVAQPVLAGRVILAADGSKSLFALDASTGTARWVDTFTDLVSATPVVAGGAILAITEDGTARVLDSADGRETSSTDLGAVASAPPAVGGDVAVVADQGGGLTAISLPDGQVRWTAGLNGALAEGTGPLIAGGEVVAVQDGGTVSAFSLSDGTSRWTSTSRGETKGSPATAGGLLVLVAANHAVALDLDDGTEAWRTPVGETVDVPPVVVGRNVLVLDETAGLHRFDLSTGRERDLVHLPPPDARTEVTGEQPMSFLGGSLVVRGKILTRWPFDVLFAFPAPGRGERPFTGGVRLAGTIRSVPQTPVTPPVLRGGHLFLASSFGEGAWDVPPAGPPTTLASGTPCEFALPVGDLVVIQVGRELRAVRAADGEVVWNHRMGTPSTSVRPAVTRGTVVVPVEGKGLEGLDLRTGARRWFRPMPQAVGHSTPVALPGGDVAYTVGSLAAFDARTGKTRWEQAGFTTFAPIAADDGTLFAEVVGPEGVELVAADAATGKLRWHVPFDATIDVGPAAGDGVVAAVDSSDVLTVFDERDGRRLWSVPLRTAPNGSPVVVDGRVVVQEQGRYEDVQQRDYRLDVLEARTGRLAAQWEFAGSGFPGVASLGAADDVLLVPTIGFGTELLLLRMEAA